MSSPEYEGFGVTENDVLNAIDPLRRQKKRTKEEMIYGMWADSGSDNESGHAGLGLRSGKAGRPDYSKPVSFISGGLKKTQEELSLEDQEKQESDIPKFRQKEKRFPGIQKVGGTSGEVADWERHTKGIGKRLLGKMGWAQGQGLGKNLQGIAKPVEAYVRKGKGALGFYGSEKAELATPSAKEGKVSAAKEVPVLQQQLGQWKKTPGSRKKVQYVVRSSADIAAEGEYRTRYGAKTNLVDSAITAVKVIDLTGKDKVVYSGYSSISKHHIIPGDERRDGLVEDRLDSSTPKYFDVPELRHNLKLLITSSEEEVIDNLRKKDRETDQIACLAHDSNRLEEVIAEEARMVDQLQNVLHLVKQVETVSSLENAMALLNQLESEYETEYKLYGLDRLLLPTCEPLIRSQFSDWDPLDRSQSDRCLSSICQLREAISNAENTSASGVTVSHYDSLIWEVWMPPVRQAIVSRWNPRDPEGLVVLMEKWHFILPVWIWNNICDQLLVPRILTEAENWNPITDTLPIHSWIHPWLGLLSEKLEHVYLPIRQKIGSALSNWHPSDPSAHILLLAWVKVWSEGHMRAFLLQHIGPKLSKAMQDFVVNPRQQQLDVWKWVFDWLDMLPLAFFVGLLERHFFPKWLSALASWLDTAADYEEVTKWYVGWKSAIPSALVNEPVVKENLGKALAMMNQSLTGGRAESVLTASVSSNYMQPVQTVTHPSAFNAAQYVNQSVPNSSFSFKELIERRAEANGILFMPLNRRDGQQQMYQLGRIQLYIDRNVIFVLNNGAWAPVSLDELFNMIPTHTR